MRKKIVGSIAVLAVVAVTAFNINKNKESAVSNLVLANIEALANNEDGEGRKCIQDSKYINERWLCDNSRYSTQSGTRYSLKKSNDGTLSRGKSGFEGTITNPCAANPNDETKHYQADMVDC